MDFLGGFSRFVFCTLFYEQILLLSLPISLLSFLSLTLFDLALPMHERMKPGSPKPSPIASRERKRKIEKDRRDGFKGTGRRGDRERIQERKLDDRGDDGAH